MHSIGQLQDAVDLVPSDFQKFTLSWLLDGALKRQSLSLLAVMQAATVNLTGSFAVSMLPPGI